MSDFLHVVYRTPPPGPPGSELWAVGAERWARTATLIMQFALRTKAPIGQGENAGHFRDSITVRTATAPGNVQLKAGSSLPYAKYIRDGTRPHLIVPVRKKTLSFVTDSGQRIFATRVNHPGTRANHFAKRALEPRLPELQAAFSLVMRETFGGTA